MELTTELHGFLVVAGKEASQLGNVSAVYIDPNTKRMAALGYRTRRFGGDEYFVSMDDVVTIGKDVVLMTSEAAGKHVSDAQRPPGRSLKDLQGCWVTLMDGRHLGLLLDFDFSPDWRISALNLAEDKQLAVDPDEIEIGDEILVPVAYAEGVQELASKSPGLLRRVFGGESVEHTKNVLRRVVRRHDLPEPKQDRQAGDGTSLPT